MIGEQCILSNTLYTDCLTNCAGLCLCITTLYVNCHINFSLSDEHGICQFLLSYFPPTYTSQSKYDSLMKYRVHCLFAHVIIFDHHGDIWVLNSFSLDMFTHTINTLFFLQPRICQMAYCWEIQSRCSILGITSIT